MAMIAGKNIGTKRGFTAAAVFTISIVFTSCGGVMDRLAGNSATNSASSNSAASNNGQTASNSSANAATQETASSVPAGNCSIEYYPVSAAKQTKYKVTGVGPETYTLSQSAITETGFVEKRNFSSGLEITNNWVCEADGIRTAEFTNSGVMKNANFTMETLKSDGVTLPREPSPGKEFESNYDIKASVSAGPVKANATGKVNVKSKVLSVDEPLTIEGTEYKTVKMESVIKINLNVSGRGYEAANVKNTLWFAPSVGLVKQVTNSTLGDQTVTIDN